MAIQPKNTNTINVDVINEKTANTGVTIDGFLIKDADLGANTVSFSAIRGASNTWLRSRNAANSADLNLLKGDGSDNTILNAATGKTIDLAINGTSKVRVDGSGHLIPVTTGAVNLGAAANEYLSIYGRTLRRDSAGTLTILAAAGDVNLDTTSTSNFIYLSVGGTPRWFVRNSGSAFSPNTTDAHDLGDASHVIRDIYCQRITRNAGNITINAPGTSFTELQSGGSAKFRVTSDAEIQLENTGAGVYSNTGDALGGSNEGWLKISIGGAVKYLKLYNAHS